MSDSSLVAAARRPPSMASILNDADPAQETPTRSPDRLSSLRKKAKPQLTPLHVNIPIHLDDRIKDVMAKGIEKTTLVVAALEQFLSE